MGNQTVFDLNSSKFGRRGSQAFIGERVARTETGTMEKQLFIDLPRNEPRKFDNIEDRSQPDLKNNDTFKDKAVTTDADKALNGIVFLRPFRSGQSVPYQARIEQDHLMVDADRQPIECCFDGTEALRIRGKGCGLRFYAPLLDHEAAIDRQDGTYQVCIEASCEILFVPLRGQSVMENDWSLWHGGTQKLLLTVLPDTDGCYELAVHITPSSTERFNAYRPFDECLRENAALYADWLKGTGGGADSAEAYRAWIDLYQPPCLSERAEQAGGKSLCYEEALHAAPLVPKDEHADIFFSSTGRFDLRSVQFSRRGSFLCILENDKDRCLYLSVTRSPEMWSQRLHLIRLTPVLDNVELPYEYDVEPGRLILRTCAGTTEMCFDDGSRLHIRGTGVCLRMHFTMHKYENCCPRGNGDWEVTWNVLGSMLFVPVEGKLFCNGRWNPARSVAEDFLMEWIPAGVANRFEAVIENDYSSVKRQDRYMPFDDCVRDSVADYQTYAKRYPTLPALYAPMARLAAWVIWIHTLGPSGNLKHPVVYMTRTQWTRAFGWQQSFQAMAACGDLHEAWKLLMTIFDYLDKGGQLPDSTGDIGATYRVTKPALQGLAMLYLLRRCNTDNLTLQECKELYDAMSRFGRWWLTFRDRNKSGLPQYFHSDESPGEFCSVFREGLPLYAGDVTAFVALLAEACGWLAGRLDDQRSEAEWNRISKELVARMVNKLWDGDRFQSKLVKTDKVVESRCILGMLPVMLGDRLPKDVLDTLIAQLFNEKEYLAPNGITVESMQDQAKQSVPQGTVIFISVLVCIGLMNAGKTELARNIAERSVSVLVANGFGFFDVAKKNGADEIADPNLPRMKKPSSTTKWTSWTCACYFILADIAANMETHDDKESL